MKKLAWLLIMVLLFGCAAAEGIDFASMSDDQLQAVIDGARNELTKRVLVAAENTVLFEQEGVMVYLTGNKDVWGSDNKYLNLEVVVINENEKTLGVSMESAYINGWEVYASGLSETKSGKKQKGMLEFNLTEADISSFEEVEEIEMNIYLYDMEKWETVAELEPIVLAF